MHVAYLMGAGASQACIKLKKSPYGLLTNDIVIETARTIREEVIKTTSPAPAVERLLSDIPMGIYDIEQLISLLDESTSSEHRWLASELRTVFEKVLQEKLALIRKEVSDPAFLYAALIDMHNVKDADEELRGILTLNYDLLLEEAVSEILGRGVDYGAAVLGVPDLEDRLPVLKLHGSFGWRDDWPIRRDDGGTLWIPPGFHKRKNKYPFNLLWGKAREILDCDVLRIIGCQLRMNDWDLVSLLFSTRQANSHRKPYAVEIIDWPKAAEDIKARFPYLEARSIFELDNVGEQFISEVLSRPPASFDSLDDDEKHNAVRLAESRIGNPFFEWLRQRAETMHRDLDSIATKHGIFEQLLSV